MKRTSLFLTLAATVFSNTALAADRVLVVPFTSLNVPASQQWIPKAAQENLVADLGRTGNFNPILFQGQVIVEDNATAARLARNASAPLALRGTAQVVGDSVRLTAQLIDAQSGDTLRTALVTGLASNLLQLEDEMANQIRGTPPAPTAAAGSASVTQTPAPQPIIIISPPPAYPANPYPTYNYPQSYYPYYYPVYYVPTPSSRGHDHNGTGGGGSGGAGGGGGHFVNNGVGFNDSNLPIPNNNVLPVPNNNVLPVPNNNILPVPNNNVLPVPNNNVLPNPTINAGQNRNPKLVN